MVDCAIARERGDGCGNEAAKIEGLHGEAPCGLLIP
jgi:hypothetical protein